MHTEVCGNKKYYTVEREKFSDTTKDAQRKRFRTHILKYTSKNKHIGIDFGTFYELQHFTVMLNSRQPDKNQKEIRFYSVTQHDII